MRQRLNTYRRFSDPSALTDYEQRILDLRRQGMDWKQIAEAIGNVNPKSISIRFKIIQEKLASQCA